MKQNIKKFVFIILIAICLIGCASCKKCKKCNPDDVTNQYVPTISNPDGTFLKLGDFTITNNEAYFQMVNSFGLETLMNIMDEDIIPKATKDEKFTEFLDGIIYPDGEKSEELFNQFIANLPLSGLSDNPNDGNYYVDYYFLRYSRIQYAKKVFKDTNSSTYYTDSQKQNAFNELFSKKSQIIILDFDSSAEAKKALQNYDIDLNKLNSGWEKTDGTKLTNTEIKELFQTIYADYHQGKTDAVKEYTYSDLNKISSSLLLDLYYMNADTYTKTSKTYSGKTFLAYKVSETENLDEDGNVVTLKDKMSNVMDLLIDGTVNTTYSTAIILSEEIGADLVIYDKGLENTFKLQYDYVIASLSLPTDSLKSFTKSTETSQTNIFSYTANGTTKYVTADTFFTKLIEQYGPYLSALYMKQYLVLKDNPVLTINDFQVLDQDKYSDYYNTDITTYKEKFLADDYSQIGFPASYGWDNFVRDYLGLLSENKILINLDSSLYEDTLRTLKEKLFLDAEGNDTKVQEEMDNIAKKYFYATTIELNAYYDEDLDGKADEIETNSEKELLARKLISVIFEQLNPKSYTSVTTELNQIANSYSVATIYTNNVWKEFKEAGLILSVTTSKTYTSNSSISETAINQIKLQYDAIINFKNDPNHVGVSLNGIDLSTYYRNSKLDAPINALSFVDASCTNLIDNKICTYIITKAFDHPYISESSNTFKPTFEDYKQYYVDSSKQDSALKNCIANFYVVAISNIASDNDINNQLMEQCLELIENGITYGNINSLKEYINACKQSLS